MSSRAVLHVPRHLGDKVADKTVGGIGTWRFLIAQSTVLALWILLNSVGWFYHWDNAPFILLNLCLSFQAAFTGPIVLLSQNRQSAKDRSRDDLEADEVAQSVEQLAAIKTLAQHIHTLAQEVHQINSQQTALLEEIRAGQQKARKP